MWGCLLIGSNEHFVPITTASNTLAMPSRTQWIATTSHGEELGKNGHTDFTDETD